MTIEPGNARNKNVKKGKEKTMRTKTEELTSIRNEVLEVAEGRETPETDTLVYRMFGSLTKEMAQGVVIGINLAIREIARIDNKN